MIDKELVTPSWTVVNKDGYKIVVSATNKNQARYLAISKLYNSGKNPYISSITMGENNV